MIHGCLVSVLGLAEHKRFHRFIPMAEDDYFYLKQEGRTDADTVIEINLMEGRPKETIKSLLKALFKQFEQQLGIGSADVEIIVHQQPAYCRGFRGMTGDEANDLKYRVDL